MQPLKENGRIRKGVNYDDISKVYWVICEENEENRKFFKELQKELMELLKQESILIYSTVVSTM